MSAATSLRLKIGGDAEFLPYSCFLQSRKIVILNRLFARPVWRFSELECAVPGISQRMLSQQLRLLEKCELVKRTVHPQFPPKVEYELTELGKTLCLAMKTLVDWAMTFPKTRETSRYQPGKARKAF